MLDELLKEPDELWILFSFILFMALIWFKGRKAIMGALDARIDIIRNEVEMARRLREDAERLFQDYEAKNLEAMHQAEQVVRNAERQAEELRKKADADLAAAINLREKQMEDRIARMKQSAMEDMRRYAADLALQATAGIIAEKLDKATRDQLIDQAIKDVAKNIH